MADLTGDELRAYVLQLLTDLGATAAEVAESLRREGVTGRPYLACECPIARYMDRHLPGFVGVGDRFVVVAGAGDVTLPAGVQEFVDCFDRLQYPDLVQTAGAA